MNLRYSLKPTNSDHSESIDLILPGGGALTLPLLTIKSLLKWKEALGAAVATIVVQDSMPIAVNTTEPLWTAGPSLDTQALIYEMEARSKKS